MPPYEPKTDSKEFEVLNPGQESIPVGEAVKDSTDLTIRLWYPQRAAGRGSVTWKTESVLVYMIADLVAASRGRVEENSAAMTAHFDASGQALVAAKRVQTSILEFLTCRPDDSFAAAILIHPPPTALGGFTPGMAQGALHLTEPGQILLSAETARRLHDLPGIQLRSVPGLTTGGEEFAGLTEVVWTSQDRMERFKAQVQRAPRREESQSLGATMIVNAPLIGSATGKTGQSALDATGLAQEQRTPTPRTERVNSGDVPPLDLAHPQAFERGLDEPEPAPFLSRTSVMIGLAAVVVIGVLLWVFYPSSGARAPVTVRPTQVGGAESSKSQTPQSNPAQPSGQQPSAEPPAKPPIIAPPLTTPTKPAGQKRGRDKTPATVQPAVTAGEEQPPTIQGFEGMTQKDIPYLLQMARNDAGSGNYDQAKREYRVVLQMQPNNPDAKEGLRRLEIAAQSDH